MRNLFMIVAISLAGCTVNQSDAASDSEPTASANAGVSAEEDVDGADMANLIFYENPVSSDGSPVPGPLARAKGTIVMNGGCIWLENDILMPLVFEEGDVSLTTDGSLSTSNGLTIPIGSKIEIAGSRVSDTYGNFPLSTVEERCGVREAILVTKGTLKLR